MKFSKLTRTSRLSEGYDLKAIKEQITSLFKGKLKLYVPPRVIMEDGTPVVELDVALSGHDILIFRLASGVVREDKLCIDPNFDFVNLQDFYKYCDNMKKIVEDAIEPYEDRIIEILKSK